MLVVTATRKGLKLFEGMNRPVAELHRRQLEHMKRAELKGFIRLLQKARAEATI